MPSWLNFSFVYFLSHLMPLADGGEKSWWVTGNSPRYAYTPLWYPVYSVFSHRVLPPHLFPLSLPLFLYLPLSVTCWGLKPRPPLS